LRRQLAAAPGGAVYRVNTITGDVRQCSLAFAPNEATEKALGAGYSPGEIAAYLGMPCR
jgi:hypothetical protein